MNQETEIVDMFQAKCADCGYFLGKYKKSHYKENPNEIGYQIHQKRARIFNQVKLRVPDNENFK